MFNKKGKKSTTKSVTVLIFYLVQISFVNGNDNNIVTLLNSLVESEAQPTNVFIKSCWPISLKIEFLKGANVQVAFIDDFLYKLPVDLSPNNVMFVANLNCDWATDFANGVRDLKIQ